MRIATSVTATFVLISFFLLSISATADQELQQTKGNAISHWSPVPDSSLDALRGGFVLNNGIVVDISFQKNIFQNGVLVSQSYFQAPQDSYVLSKSEFDLSSILPNSTLNTILQNTLDNQTLSTITNIDITIKNLEQAQQAFIQDEMFNAYFGPGNY